MARETTDQQIYGDLRGFTYRVLIVIIIVVLFLFLWHIVHALLFAFIGILLAVLWRGLAGLVTRIVPVPTGWALVIVAVLTTILLGLFLWFAGAQIDKQLSQLAQTLPNSVNNVKELLKKYTWSRYLVERLASTQLSEGQQLSLVSHVTGAASTVVSVVVDAIVVLFSALYFGISPDIYVRGIISLVPENRSDRMREVFEASSQTLRYWLMGQAVAMLTIGTTVAIGLWIAGVPLAFLLGVIAGLLDFIPYLGPTAAAIPGILIGLTESPLTGVYALLVYLVVQQLENHLVVPLVQKQTVWLPPALVVLAVIVFGLLFGVLGLLVATPLTAVIVVWVKMLYVHDILGKPVDVVGKPANMG